MPATIPPPLARGQCRLLSKYSADIDDVLKAYNEAVATAGILKARFPHVLERQEPQDTLDRLAAHHRTLTTPRFKVGFLGPFQCGKSTTLNNLLGQKVTGVGAGRATTSVITRLIAAPLGTAPGLELQFFSEAEYRARRNTLCEWARLPNAAGMSESQLIERLRTHNPNRVGGSGQRPVLKDDIPYLQAFLQSYDDHRAAVIRPDPLAEPLALTEENKGRLTHDNEEDGQAKPSRSLLLSRATITYPTDRIDPELELVDCPGLGADRSVDTLLTKEYIPHLNGAIVFLRADAIYSGEAIEILSDLKLAFRDNLKARVWVVVNKMDTPSTEAKLGGDKGKTTFDLIALLEAQHGIPLSQVCLGCNDIFALASAAPAGTADRRDALKAVKLILPEHEAQVLDRLAKYPTLKDAFEVMLRDGSVAHLGGLIRATIGPSVAGQLAAEVRAEVRQAAADLKYWLVEAEGPVDAAERAAALQWENELYLVLAELAVGKGGARGPLFAKLEEHGRATRAALEKLFLDGVPDAVLAEMDTPELVGRFGVDAARMQEAVDAEFGRLTAAAYGAVTERLEKKELPPVKVGERDVLAAWHEGRQQDRDAGGWRDRLRPRLSDPDLLARLADGSHQHTLDGPRYKQLVLSKLRTAAHQLALAVRGQVRDRLGGLRREVSRKLVSGPPAPTPTPPEA